MKKRSVALLLALNMVACPAAGLAAPTIPGFYGTVKTLTTPPVNALPQVGNPNIPNYTLPAGVTINSNIDQALMVINQINQLKVTIDWKSFNIGANATVRFYQGTGTPGTSSWTPNSGYAALNRIYDQNPSQIYGKMIADGKVYLINQNGILFGPGSRVNVHSLVASALNISNDDFNKDLLRFTSDPAENFQSPNMPFSKDGVIANYGTIETGPGGSVVLLGPQVENGGNIDAPLGSVSLLAVQPSGATGYDIDAATGTINPYAAGVAGGTTVNYQGGSISTESGIVRLFGATVRHDGIIRAVTAVRQNGQIELRATDSVTTGQGSIISSPISESSETIVTSADNPYKGGTITIGGLDFKVPVKRIELGGSISAPSGMVTLNASERVYLETGSSIDVSGLWVDKPAGANLIDVQMNSVNLRDDYGQKDGIIKGETVAINPLYGSKIGSDISGYLTTAEKSASDQSTTGGTIDISAGAGDVILKTGATLDFAGGGVSYAAGSTRSVKLVSGNTVYDFSSAPEWLSYRAILGTQQSSHARWGLVNEYKGLYFGGGNAVNDMAACYIQGSDAGTLILRAANVVLDGSINGRATAGVFQTVRTTDADSRALSVAEGLETPEGGTLIIGDLFENDIAADHRLGDVVLTKEVAQLPGTVTPDSLPHQTTTYLSTDKLNAAGLSTLSIVSNQSVTTTRGSTLALDPAGAINLKARRIEHNGDIAIPDGTVNFTLLDNKTSEHWNNLTSNPDYVPLQERIYLADGSRIDVSGDRVDNSSAGIDSGVRSYNYIGGGTISLADTRELGREVIVAGGALLDVSGGYGIDAKGKVTGGDAGTLSLKAPTVVLDGELRGLSLPDKAGGALILQAKQVNVVKGGMGQLLPESFTASSDLPADLGGEVTFGDSRFASTGFSRFTLKSFYDLVVPGGTTIRPSYVKLAIPVPGGNSSRPSSVTGAGSDEGTANNTVTVGTEYVGASSFTATAGDVLYTGSNFYDPANNPANDPSFNKQKVELAEGAAIDMAPGGKVSLSAPTVAIAGDISAPAGSITAEATFGNFTVESTGRLLANGYNKVNSSTIAGLPVGPQPVAGGSVSLAAKDSISLATDSLVDVSGSPLVTNLQASANGTPSPVSVAGDAGTLSLTFGNGLRLDGAIDARTAMDGLKGGTLFLKKFGSFIITAALIEQEQRNGFDAMTLNSTDSLIFAEGMTLNLPRSLTLDAPVIKGNGFDVVSLNAPWLRIMNSTLPALGQPASGTAQLNLASDGWIDIEGAVQAAGFSDINLTAQHDLRLSDHYYNANNSWGGKFITPGNLTIQAGTVYPTTQAKFTLAAQKKITILGNGGKQGPVYSVGGNLTIDGGEGIEQGGDVEAPLGTITLQSAANRVYLADGSITSTAAEAPQYYGALDSNLFWTTTAHAVNAVPDEVPAAPDKNVILTGNEVVIRDGATVNISGGGGVFSYLFQKGIEGSSDPFLKSGRYVIMPDNSVQLPGNAVYLAGGAGIAAGMYSLLPEQYAFLPGAMVLTATGKTATPGAQSLSQEGYPVVGGYMTVMGTDIRSPQLQGFSVRSAADVRTEGHFDIREFTAGDAGTLKVSGTSTVLGGTINAAALNDYRGGILDLSGTHVIVQSVPISLPDGFDFASSLPVGVSGSLQLADQTVNGKGLAELRLGNSTVTDSVTIKSGSTVDVPAIILTARNTVSIETGASLNALAADGSGSVSIVTPQGSVTIADNATVHAGSSISIEANNGLLNGSITTNDGTLSLTSDQLYVVNGTDADRSTAGIYLTDTLWNSTGAGGTLSLTGHRGVTFRGDLALRQVKALTIDTSRLAGVGQTGACLKVTAAASINLLNSGAFTGTSLISAPTGAVTFSAENIVLGGNSSAASQGALLLDGFRSITLDSDGDLTLMGQGALKTGWTTSLPGQELVMTGARLVTAPYRDGTGNYQRADFAIDGSHGAISFSGSDGNAGTTTWAGGRMRMTGDSLVISGIIDVPAGDIALTAVGASASDGITLVSGSEILSRGALAKIAVDGQYTAYDGGTVTLAAANGTITLAAADTAVPANPVPASLIDVSAAGQGDAGSVNLSAPNGGVALNGDLAGNASAGRGGSFIIDSKTVDLTALKGKLVAGGFNEKLAIRARTGDLALAAGDTLSAREILLAADGTDGLGNVRLDGSIIAVPAADGTGGGVEIYAQNNLALSSGSHIETVGITGGDIHLGSVKGIVTLDSGAVLDTSGETPEKGGTVSFRALRNTNSDAPSGPVGVNMELRGEIKGASQVVAEAYQVYGDLDTGMVDTADYMGMNSATVGDNALAIRTGLLANLTTPAGWDASKSAFHFRPGVEVQVTGDLTQFGRDFTSDRYPVAGTTLSEPGVLTLRTTGNLTIAGDLVDHPTPIIDFGTGAVLERSTAVPSWSFNLVAGADLGSANPMAVTAGTGRNLTLADLVMVYTEKGSIGFAAGHDMTIGAPSFSSYMLSDFMQYNLGTYDGAIRGTVGNNLTLNGGVIQSATGDIDISVGRDLTLGYAPGDTSLIGSIRTTGEYMPSSPASMDPYGFPTGFLAYWDYHGGGDIRLSTGNNIFAQLSAPDSSTGTTPGWDMVTDNDTGLHWSANFSNIYNPQALTVTTQGVATMGGGSITLRSGGDVRGQFGVFVAGDLRIRAGGELSGRFLVKEGDARMTAGGDFAPLASANLDGKGREITPADGSLVELFHGDVDIAAQGSVTLGTVVNPTVASGDFSSTVQKLQNNWNLDPGYQDSSVSLSSVNGDVAIIGRTGFYAKSSADFTIYPKLLSILPPTLNVYAGGTIRLLEQRIALAPSPTGTLRLVAGLDIGGGVVNSIGTFRRAEIYMSDVDPSDVYGSHKGFDVNTLYDINNIMHALTPVHTNDSDNPNILAAQGDITDLKLFLPKATSVRAGNDITDIQMVWQNVAATDISSIVAGRNITFTTLAGSSNIIQMGGPGNLLVMAGDTIDLGTTKGIQAVGNTINPMLPDERSGLFVAAGTSPSLTAEMITSFFPLLRDAGSEYSDLLAAGETDKAKQVVETIRTEQIAPLFVGASETASGRINMISSQISTLGTNGDIFVVVGSDINVGKSAIGTSKADSGIFTASGGAVNVFARNDVNVNESKIMTFRGGDITLWSDEGSINAGRGSKTAISASPPHTSYDPTTKTYKLVFSPPSVGSGIRAVTYDPDGPSGPETEPPAGDIYAFAPQGIIDAGEAGIAGGRVILGATHVLNAQNISFSAGSVGVPSGSETSFSLGSLSGQGAVADAAKSVERGMMGGDSGEMSRKLAATMEKILSGWLDVKVIGFDSGTSGAGQ